MTNSNRMRMLALILVFFRPMVSIAQTETLDYVGSAFTNLTMSGNLSNALRNVIAENSGEVVWSAASSAVSI